jgi:Ca-activated chloride channel family protein
MSFLQPAFLVLLAAALLPWLVRGARAEPGHTALRSALLALLALALARPAWIDGGGGAHHVFVLDASDSVPAAERARAASRFAARAAALPAAARTTLVTWGAEVEGAAYATVLRLPAEAGSPLGAALAAAARAIPEGEPGAVLVATDGAASRRDWGEAVAELAARGIPVHELPLAGDAEELRLVGLAAEGELRRGHPARVRLTLAGRGRARVALRPAGEELALAEADEVSVDGRRELVLEFEPAEAGFLRVEAALEALDGRNARPADDRLAATLPVQEPVEVLYLGERQRGGAEALAKLVGPGFRFAEAGDLEGADPSGFPLVVLDDRTAATVPASFQQRLGAAVEEGGTGLLMSGGAAFGPGGWAETPLEELLPVELVQKEEKRDPSTTLCVIIDTSGSMGGNRVQLAKEVARLAIRRLLPHDKVGIVEFYGAKRWAAPIQPASNLIELERALNRLDAGGGTVILPAIEEAFYGMQNVQTRYKHVLVLTDGGVETGPFESMLRRMSDEGMNVSTVLIGPEAHSEFLVNLANWGKGRFYNVPNRFNLPEIILKQPASAKLPGYRPGTHAVRGRGGPAWWSGADPQELPALSGYVETRSRPGTEVLVETVDGAHPVLASWRAGLGRVTALTTEPAGAGTQPWSEWPGFGALAAQVLARTADAAAEPFRWSAERRGDEVLVVAERRRPGAGTPLLERFGALDGSREALPAMVERAPGRFELRLPVAAAEELWALGGAAGDPRRTRLVAPAAGDAARELQVDPQEALLPSALAGATGGRLLASAADAAPAGAGRALRLREAAPLLLLAALALFLVDLTWRRRPTFRGGRA